MPSNFSGGVLRIGLRAPPIYIGLSSVSKIGDCFPFHNPQGFGTRNEEFLL